MASMTERLIASQANFLIIGTNSFLRLLGLLTSTYLQPWAASAAMVSSIVGPWLKEHSRFAAT